MDTESSTQYLRPHVLQHTPQQISLPTDEAPERCVICLGDFVDQCEAQPCGHNGFDYLCLVTWLQQRASCPLCKSEVYQVRYDLGEDQGQGKVYKVPESCKELDKRAEVRLPYEEEAIQRRRFIYRHNLYSLHIGSNSRQPTVSAYKELSPQLFATDPTLLPRARRWLRRELRVFGFLDTSGNAQLLDYIVAILKTMDIQDSDGQAEQIVQEFLGLKFAQLFLHELKAWLRSPFESLRAWDFHAQYSGSNILPSPSGPNIVLRYNEPADARKPPLLQAWRLYIFKGDELLQVVELSSRSVWLLGREEEVVDQVISHPSCSGQHAALQFRYTRRKDELGGREKSCVSIYLIDLNSTNGSRLNGQRIRSNHYVEIRHKDVITFGGSKREYVIILPPN